MGAHPIFESDFDCLTEMAEKTWTQEIIESPVNLALLAASGYLIYKIICDLTYKEEPYVPPPKLVKDMTLKELRRYNGKDEQKICLAIKGEIFDVTRGRNFYGPGGPYDVFAGREASRAFANFSTDEEMLKMEKDDLSDLNAGQISQLEDWYMSISSKYDKVGKVLYEDDEVSDSKPNESGEPETATEEDPYR